MKRDTIIYWIGTGFLCAIMTFSALMYVFKHDMVAEVFTLLGYPTYIIYPFAAAKIAGVYVILSGRFTLLKEWAYAGFFFAIIFANLAHIMAGDGGGIPAHLALVAWAISYYYDKKR